MTQHRMKIAILLTTAIVATLVPANADLSRPNIVYVMADDLGIGDVKCFGKSRCKIETPHFDKLADEGMRFTDAHSVAAVCVPSRVSIMTGNYAWRSRGARPSGPWGFLNPRLKPDDFTLARMLKSVGYKTGYVGKWHLGTLMPTNDGKNQNASNVDYSQPIKFGPIDYGFDFGFILPGSLDMYPYVFNRNNSWVGEVTKQRGWSAFNRVGPTADDFEDYKVLNTFCANAEHFIEANARAAKATGKNRKPFFLYLALTSPHTPISPRPEFQGRSKLGVYGDFVMETDDCVGRMVRALEKHGLSDNTLFIATSDHGPASYAGNRLKATPGQVHQLEKKGHWPSGIFRGYKFSIYEGGHRIPLVVRWPNVIAKRQVCDRLVGLNDLMATLADIVNVRFESDQAVDSVSYLSLLKNPKAPAPRQTMIQQSTNVFAVRKGKWKLCVGPGCGARGVYGNRPIPEDAWKAAIRRFGRSPKSDKELRAPAFVQLFDLEDDPTESKNLASERPNLVTQLFAILDEQIRNGRSTRGPRQHNDLQTVNIHGAVPKFVWEQKEKK